MNKKTYFQQLCELNYSATLMNHGYMIKGNMLSRHGK
jgi:hypothetical protein